MRGAYMETKLVCFDLDDTLIREIHSVMLPCLLNGKEAEHAIIQRQEEAGKLDYIQADYARAKLFQGLTEETIAAEFLNIARPLHNIRRTVETLQSRNVKCIVITVGPVQVAKVVADIWGFDGYYGSEYEVQKGKFTGRIMRYIQSKHKIDCLVDYCKKHGIDAGACIAVGDGATDIPVFRHCGKSIALNAAESVKSIATYAVDTNDLTSILQFI